MFGVAVLRRKLQRRAVVAMAAGGGDDVVLAATRVGVGWRDESGQGKEEDAVTMAAGISSRGRGGRWTTRLQGEGRRRRRVGFVGSFPAAGATPTDTAMPLSPPTDDGDNHDNEGEGRRDEKGGGRRQGTRAVGG